MLHDARTMDREQRLVGFNDEILDLCLTPTGRRHCALASAPLVMLVRRR